MRDREPAAEVEAEARAADRRGSRRVGWVLVALGALAVGGVAYVGPVAVLRETWIAVTEDTDYAPGYTEEAFRRIESGDSESSVREALGAPFDTLAVEPYTEWLYAPGPQREFGERGEVGDSSVSYTLVRFDADGRLTGVGGQISLGSRKSLLGVQSSMMIGDGANSLGLTDAEVAALVRDGATTRDIELRHGRPSSVYSSRAVGWLVYSRSPSSTDYRVRQVGIDGDGRVCEKRRHIHWD